MSDSNQEALREALLNVQRLRQKEQKAREQMETLIQGLQILNESRSVAEMFQEILGSLQRVIPFDSAAIVVQSSPGFLTTAVSSDSRLKFASFPVAGVFQRCLRGRATAVTRIDRIAEWPEMSAGSKQPLQSALLVELPGLEQATIIICASEQASLLKRSDLKMLQTFSPLATQAVQRASEMEQLNLLINKLDYSAHYDMLTGLPNRTLFDIRLEQEFASDSRNFTVLFVDLDKFKHINDTYGHNAGDILLGELGFRLSSAVSENDTVARMGGDEFAILLRNQSDIESIYAICNQLITRAGQPIYLRNYRIEPTISIGIAICSDHSLSAQTLMQNADIALYETKRAGRDGFRLFSLEMKARLDRQQTIESKLKTVIDDGELWLAYQTINHTSDSSCHNVEALLRWGAGHSVRYTPAEFIPQAESSGAIYDIGLWVLRTALSELSEWLTTDSRNQVAINISDVQLHQPGLAADFLQIVASSPIQPGQIELELSEQIIAASIDDTVIANLNQLESHGFRFSYDDFGTGQASFLNLQRLPGTRLKIDKAFVDNIEHSDGCRNLIAGIIDFAHKLKLDVVAEGVESVGQLEILTALECDYAQGYCLSHPLPALDCLYSLSAHQHDQRTNAVGE